MSVSQKASPLQWVEIRKVLQVLAPSGCWDVPQDSSVALVPLALASSVALVPSSLASSSASSGALADAYRPDFEGLCSCIQAILDIELEVFSFFLARCL